MFQPFLRSFSRLRLTTALLGLLAATALLQPGCAMDGNAPRFPTPDATWQTYTGQMHYSGPRSIVGDVVVRRHGNADFQMAFSSGPGFPLLQLRESGNAVSAEGVLARGRWSGKSNLAPKHLWGFVKLREIFNGLPAAGGKFYVGDWEVDSTVVGGKLQHLVVSRGSERFTFHFSR